VLHRIVGYTVSRSAVEGLLGLRGVAIASFLGPELFGAWSLFRLALHYFGFVGQTLNRGMEVEVAAAGPPRGKLVAEAQRVWGQIVLGPTLCLYGLLTAGVALALLWPFGRLAELTVLGIAVALIPERLWRYALTFVRAVGMFRRFAILEFLHAVLQLTLTVAFAFAWGLGGALAGYLAATLTSLCIAARQVPWRPRWSLRQAGQVFRIGFPVSLTNISTTILQTIDQLLVGAFSGIAALGLYAFAVSLSGLGVHVALIVRNVILTDVYGAKGEDHRRQTGRLIMDRSLAAFSILLPPLAGFVALVMSPAVLALLPHFGAAIILAQIFIFIGVLQGIVNVSVMGVVAEGHQGRVPLICLGAVTLNISLSVLALSLGLGLIGVAVGALLSRMAYAAATTSVLTASRPNSAGYGGLTRSLAPTIWCAFAVAAIQLTAPAQDWESLAIAILLYSLALIPLGIVFRSTIAESGILRFKT